MCSGVCRELAVASSGEEEEGATRLDAAVIRGQAASMKVVCSIPRTTEKA